MFDVYSGAVDYHLEGRYREGLEIQKQAIDLHAELDEDLMFLHMYKPSVWSSLAFD